VIVLDNGRDATYLMINFLGRRTTVLYT